MGFKKPTRNLDIYISQKDMVDFFNVPENIVIDLIKKGLLRPKKCEGKILYRFTELMRAGSVASVNICNNL